MTVPCSLYPGSGAAISPRRVGLIAIILQIFHSSILKIIYWVKDNH